MRTIQEETRMAVVVSVHAGLDAFIAARATIQVDQHQLLTLDQAEFLEAVG